MPFTFKEIKQKVVSVLGQESYDAMLHYLQGQEFHLWGRQQPEGFVEKNMALVFYKHITHLGYQHILKDIKFANFKLNHKSLQTNSYKILKILAEWSEDQIKLGHLRDWNRAAEDVVRPGKLKNVNLWMDSSDFPLENPIGWSKKDPEFSSKLDRYGRRYMFLIDGHGRVRKVWGGYTPKLYDGHFIELKRKTLDRKLKGADIIADNSFEYGQRFLKKVTLWTNPKQASGKVTGKRNKAGDNIPKHTHENEGYLEQHQTLRASVETTFGILKTMFKAFEEPWAESVSVLDNLVMIAVAVNNMKL